jgi:hypothetical protein
MLRCTESSPATRSRRDAFRRGFAVVAVALLLGGFGGASPSVAADSAAYIDKIADLPLMDGLREVPDAGVSFDKPSGRIVEAFAHGDTTATAVRRFYEETLPQLGWTALGRDAYGRESEKLTLDYLGRGGDLTVRFTIQPR